VSTGAAGSSLQEKPMTEPKIQVINTPEYRESYANSVQVRVNLWDFFLLFGTLTQQTPEAVAIQNFQGVYLSPQQAKALLNILQQNVSQYEATFGEIRLEPQPGGPSPDKILQ
jgi:flagellar protein FlaG